MSKLERSLLGFFFDFVQSHSSEVSTSEYLVRKMIKNKQVQRTLIDCLNKLEPILSDEYAFLKSARPRPKENSAIAESRLISLSKDVKKLLKNFDSIKNNLENVTNIVESIDTNLHKNVSLNDSSNNDEQKSDLVEFLSNISRKRLLFDFEFDEISTDTWSKHLEVEKMLNSEIFVYESRIRMLENQHFQKVSQIKLKAGLKIQRLENQIKEEAEKFLHRIGRLQMIIEEKKGLEVRKLEQDLSLMNEDASFYFIPDIPTAINKIKCLLAVRQILEKNRKKDEVIIQGLNSKIKLLAEEFLESQEKLIKATQNFSIVSLCLARLIQKSGLEQSDKSELLEYLNSLQFSLLEAKFEDELLVEFLAGKVYVHKARMFLYNPKNDLKDEGFKEKMIRFLEEEITENEPGSAKRSSSRSSGNQLKRVSVSRQKAKQGSPNYSPVKDPDSPLNSMKKIMTGLDMELKSKNKQVAENLSEIISSFKGSQGKSTKEAKGVKVRTKLIDIQVPKNYQNHEKEIQTGHDLKSFFMKSQESLACSETQDVNIQTDLNCLDVKKYEDYYFNHDFIDLYQVFMKTRKADKEVQTDKKIKFKEFDDSKLLIKGLMKKTALAFHTTIKDIKNKALNSETATHREATPVPNEPEDFTERKESNQISDAQDLYQKEFAIYSQFLGLKKFDFLSLQKIWEEVINRRLVEGEKDKITSHLRTVFGTESFEQEKQKVIQMLSNIKQDQNMNNSYALLLRDFHKKVNVLDRWQTFMIHFIKANLSKFFNDPSTRLDLLKISIYLKMLKKSPEKESNTKSDTVLVFKNQDWRISSKSPVQSRKKIKKVQILKQPKNFDNLFRLKTPSKLKNEKLPSLNLFK